jgi:thiosulfate/3-mercaptopyruvate sulfurtransferase
METLEILLWISSYCDTNRWAIGVNSPLEAHRKFVTEKPKDFTDQPSLVAPLSKQDDKATTVEAAVAERPRLESREQVEAKLDECRRRVPLLPLASVRDTLAFVPDFTRKDAPGVIPDGAEVATWMRQYAIFPKTGGYKVLATVAEAARGRIDPLLRARINWICARHDRAWYALGQAKRRLLALGQSEDAVYALDGDWSAYPQKDRLVFAFAQKMTLAPTFVTDKDVADLQKYFDDTQVAELINRASSAAMIDRMGEACNLPLEEAIPAYDTLGTEEVKVKRGQPDWVIVDVRDSNSFNGWALDGGKSGGRIAGAVNVAGEWVEKDMKRVKEVLAAKEITRGDKQLLLYGRNDAEASYLAQLLETRHGVARARLHVYKDGFAAWAAAGLPTDKLERHEWLVPPSWLERERKTNPKLRVFAVSWNKVEEYEQGHVPGSFYIDTNLLETPPIWDLVPRDKLVEALLSLGITRDTPVVVYGPQPMPSFFAAAVLRHAGVKDVRVLNGGFPAWQAAGLPVEKGRNRPKLEHAFTSSPIVPRDIFVGIDEARKILADPNKVLVDVRSWKEYVGETPGYDDITAKGRIPGAVWGRGGSSADNMEDYRNPDGTMRDHRDVERAWREVGITPEKTVGFYCGTGWRASEAYLAARMMGWNNVLIYDGGWYEWSADRNNPIATGDPTVLPSDGARPWWRGPLVYTLAPVAVLTVVALVWRVRAGRVRRRGREPGAESQAAFPEGSGL